VKVRILVGDVMDRLRAIPSDTYDCVITSPPYWGLRDYGVEGQIGLEPTIGQHLDVMVSVFEEVKRVLKPTGTLWLNYGDCYATAPNGRSAADTKLLTDDDRTFRDKPFSTVGGTLKPKDLCMVPNRLAIALQDAGWWVRAENIWGKLNPMPESIDDRPATAHEKVFMLSKSGKTTLYRARDTGEWCAKPDTKERIARPTPENPDATVNRWRAFDYFYDADAVRVGMAESSIERLAQNVEEQEGSHRANGGKKANGSMKAVGGSRRRQGAIAEASTGSSSRRMAGFNERWGEQGGSRRNSFARSGKLATDEYRQKPQFREDREPVDYGSGGRNLRNYEPAPLDVWRIASKPFSDAHFATFPPALAARCILAGCPIGGLVLDPFGGAGTTGMVAAQLRRNCDVIELNPEYATLARDRLMRDFGLLDDVEIVP
jgi:DNA modification methylase